MVNEQGLKKGLLLLVVLLAVAIVLYATLMIGGLIVGSVANTAVGTWNGSTGTGQVTLSDGMKDSLVQYETDYITNTESVSDNVPLIIGLVAIVVIMIVFGFKFKFGGSKKQGVN